MIKKRLTVERFYSDPNLNGPTPIRLQFSPDGRLITYLRPKDENDEVLDLWAYDIQADRHAPLVRTEELIPPDQIEISEQEAAHRERMRIRQTGIVDYHWDRTGERLLFPLSGALYVYSLAAAPGERVRCILDAQSGPIYDPKFSPQGTAIAFCRAGNLFVVSAEGGEARPLTFDGRGTVQNGVAEFVAQEEMGRHTGYWWSPDGQHIAYAQIDEAPVALVQRPAYYADRVEVIEQRYPAAGEANALVRVGVVAVETGRTTWMDTPQGDIYIARVDWLPDSRQVAIQVQPRDQKTLNLVFADAGTGASRLVLREQDDCWVELHDDLCFLKQSEQFIWSSERTGYNHLYLYARDGQLIRPLTQGQWPVDKLSGVDEEHGLVYFEGWVESPAERHLYRVPLAGGPVEQVTRQPGWHQVTLATDCLHLVDTHSDALHPPQVHLYAIQDPSEPDRPAGASLVTTLEANELPERDEYEWVEPEFVTLQAADGTSLHGRLTRPPDFDPEHTYPTIVTVYGGPHAQTVKDAWDLSAQLLAHHGLVVFELDNRGMGNRGKAFATALFQHMGGVEVADQLVGVEYLKTLPYVDPQRIGIFGWSYGGYMTLKCLVHAPGVFKAGVAVAPVTDWKLYDTHYTERYMGHPAQNAEGYTQSSVLAHAGNLSSKLLLVHGMADDNVLLQHSVLLMDALQRARIPFEMMAYPGAKHGIRGKAVRTHLFDMIVAHLRRHLV